MGHIPVLFHECIENLNIKPDGVYVDMTLGGFGHGSAICERLSKNGIYVGFDKDTEAIERVSEKVSDFDCQIHLVHSDFKDYREHLDELGISKIDGCLIDLGVSSFQLDDARRGFSFNKDAKLDMRMDTTQEFSAYDVVNTYSKDELVRILKEYGEERFASKIADRIISNRNNKPIETTLELVSIVESCIPYKMREKGKNPATRTFQAIRIEVNRELTGLDELVESVVYDLNDAGRLCIITFHSLEDKIVKSSYARLSQGCTCPKEFPVCVCGNKPKIKKFKDVTPSKEELDMNKRSRSARLRYCERIIEDEK